MVRNRSRGGPLVAAAFLLLVPNGFAVGAAASRPAPAPMSGTAEAPVFRAADLLSPAELTGPEYSVEEAVAVKDGRFQFILRTPYGKIPAAGSDLMEIRIEEMRAIDRARRLAKEPQLVNGVMDSFKQTGKGLEALVTDPGEALKSIPKGIGRKFKSLTDKSSRRAGGDTRRTFAAELGADPETRNPVLKKMLDKLSLERGIGQSVISVATIGATGGVAIAAKAGSAMRTTADMQETIRSMPLYKINEKIAADLSASGISAEMAEEFSENQAFTTLQRLLFMEQYRAIAAVRGASVLVDLGVRAENEPEALGVIHLAALVRELHSHGRIQRLELEGVVTAQLASGAIVACSAADFIAADASWKRRFEFLRQVHPRERLVFLAAGRLSPGAQALAAEGKIELVDGGQVTAIK